MRFSCLIVVSIDLVAFCGGAAAAITDEQRKEIAQMYVELRDAGTKFQQQKFEEAGQTVRGVQERAAKLVQGNDTDVLKAMEEVYKRLNRAHALLELEGIELPPLVMPLANPSPPGPMPSAGGVSFVKQIAPVLVAKCGRCHIEGNRGEFQMTSYVQLLRGSSAGVVLFPGDPAGSRLVELISNGDMPRGGNKLTADELAAIQTWIKEGAKFDGSEPNASLHLFAAPAAAPDAPPTVTRATGIESVSFARDIAPVLAESCSGCHVDPPQRARGDLNMTSFTTLLRGGENGQPIMPRKPADSLLVQRIKGLNGEQRMPLDRAPLADAVIAKIEQWIREGAGFDGDDPNQRTVLVAAIAKARHATHDELLLDRVKLAEQNWRLGMNTIKADQQETTNFLVMGNVGPTTLNEFTTKAEALAPRVAALFGADANQPLLKGRLTLFVLNQRYDYSEFGQMVEKRELPKEWRGHWQYTVTDAYGAMIAPRNNEYSTEALVAEQLAGAYIASLNNPPRWFADGAGRAAAAQIAPKDSRVTAWNSAVPAALATMKKPDDFLGNTLPPEAASVGSYSYVKYLMADKKRFASLLDGLREGKQFAVVFVEIYGGTPAQVAEVWARTAARQSAKKR